MEISTPKLYPIKETADRLGLSVSTVYRLAEDKKLDIVKIGARSLVTETSMTRLIDDLPRLVIRRRKSKRKASRKAA